MKRFLRWLINGLTILSLLLGLAAAGLWGRTRTVTDCWEYVWPDRYGYIWSHSGGVVFVLTRQRPIIHMWDRIGGWEHTDYPPHMRLVYDAPTATPGDTWYTCAGVITGSSQSRGQTWVSIPYWLILLATALPPMIRLMRRLLRRRPAAGHCAACGYDLRASPERCPECGAVAAKGAI